MKRLIIYFILLFVSFTFATNIAAAQGTSLAEELQEHLVEPLMPGRLEGTGTYFELKDSDYLNITLDSTEPIKLVLESVREMVTLDIASVSVTSSTQITLGGFLPSTTYYKYENDYHNLVTFTTDSTGRYTYIQDLSKPHFVFIQPRPSTIFLSDTGWSDPTVGTWDPVTRTATLTTDLNQTIQIDANNVTLDGNGHTISGSNTGSGVYLYERTGITIKSLVIMKFSTGIYLRSSNNNTLTDNITNNNYYGIYFRMSGSNTLRNNLMSGNDINFDIMGLDYSDFDNDIDTTNLVDNKPIYYLVSVSDIEINSSSNAGIVYCFYCDSITVKDLILINRYNGIWFHNTNNSKIKNNHLNSNSMGIRLSSFSNSNTITDNTVSNNSSGIFLTYSTNNILTNNIASNNSYGIYLRYSSHNTVTNNAASNNRYGISLSSSDNNILTDNIASNNFFGISLSYSSPHNTIAGNIVSNNNYGIYSLFSNSNTITENTASNNSYSGIGLSYSSNNKIYLNNFIDNTRQAYDYSGSGNLFNLDKPIGGNYWNDWTAPDNDGDGFVDFPYIFSGGQDNLPWASKDGWLVVAPTTLSEKSSSQLILTETLLSQRANLINVAVSGDLEGLLNFTDFEMVSISTGPFAGKGFSKGQFEITLEGVPYKGNWQGVLFFKPEERKIYLKGSVTGGVLATVEGYITESTSESSIYDQYQATWKIGQLGSTITSATINLKGNLSYQDSSEYSSTELYFLQTNIEGRVSGRYAGSLNTVLTHLRILSEDNPYLGEGLSIISYASLFGSGEGWTYNKLIEPHKVELKGMSTSPLLGILFGTLDETELPRELFLTIQGIDLGLPPAPDLKVKVWGPQRVSPGDTIDYIIEYRNDGLKAAEETLLFVALDYSLKYISASPGAFYNDILNTVDWNLGNLPAKSSGYLTIQAEIAWGLPQGTTLETDAIINELLPHSDKKGIFVNGFGLYVGEKRNVEYAKICNKFASSRDVEWIEAYNTGTRLGDFTEAINALNGVATEHNGLLNDKVTGGFEYETAYGYSAGTLTLFSAIAQGKLKTKELVLISPVGMAPFFLESLHSLGIEKIIIYQSENDKLPAEWLTQLKIPKDDPLRNEPWLEVIDMDNVKHPLWLQKLLNEDNKNKENMSSSTPHTITTARDPNEKLVSPEGDVGTGDRLSYTINYENEGEGTAYGVYIADTLDEDLNDSTLVVNDSGTYDPETRTITWFIGEVGSGVEDSVSFSINVKEDVPNNAEVINFATVYFPSVPEATRTNGTVNPVITAPIDTTPPVTTMSVSPSANQAGWNNTDVTINLIAADEADGSGVKEVHYRLTEAITKEEIISGSTIQIILTTEDTTNLTYWAEDNAGNIETAKSFQFKIDKTPPTLTYQTSPQPNTYGWNNTDVVVTFTATDSLSGVSSITDPITVTTEGASQHIGGEAIDIAGNIATTYAILNIDRTPPQVTITANPNTLWPPDHKMIDVTIGGEAIDNLSGIASSIFKVEDEYNTVEPIISDFNTIIQLETWRDGYDLDGRNYTISVITKDKADNISSASTTVICPHDEGIR